MIYKRFRLQVVTRALLLSATLFLFFYLLFQTSLHVTVVLIGLVFLYQLYGLIHYIEKTNRDLTRFFEAIKHSDFSQSFSVSGLGSSFDELQNAFTAVIAEFQRARAEKEEQYHYLQTVVQHIGIGLISFQRNGEVELINTAAKRLLHVKELKNINSLESKYKKLVKTLHKLKAGSKALVKIEENGELQQLAIYATQFKLLGGSYTLVSLQNIQSELEEKEMEAWQNLIRVLTHEIMNSVTPIASLASTINDLLSVPPADGSKGVISTETIGDVRGALKTIERRSHGLLNFVDAYRNLTRLPRPEFKLILLREFFARMEQLLSPQLEEKNIAFVAKVEPDNLELFADPELTEQMLLNLVLNAIEAVDGVVSPSIGLRAKTDENARVLLQVADNGHGISEEVQEKIFIPFFTTKKKGSGIGLSLSRQIMRMHRGSISVASKPGVETVFTLRF